MVTTLANKYRSSLDSKENDLRDRLGRASLETGFSGVVPSPVLQGYRSRAKFSLFPRPDNLEIRARNPMIGETVPFDEVLWILPDWAGHLVRGAARAFRDFRTSAPVDGFELRLSHGYRKAHLTLSVKRGREPWDEDLIPVLFEMHPELRGVAVPSRRLETGETFLSHSLAGRDLVSHYRAFFQSHLQLLPKLLEDLYRDIGAPATGSLLDLYCGCGFFSLLLSDPAAKILGMDNNPWAIESAHRNAAQINSGNAEFKRLSAESGLNSLKKNHFDLVILDPPRSGCGEEVITAAAALDWHRLVLVSCDMSSLFIDLEGLVKEGGCRLDSLKAYDMFPFTPFLETVSIFYKK